ncbi:DENN domain-containing protein Crag isoform X2 [Macrobrachium rosenbergii]|uniref:DENN domain-containing protein Crag isoform X2 n=1 Tax=Macrobrachium rosenbergii TaxID=79674 RepID=UPI0034D5B5BB
MKTIISLSFTFSVTENHFLSDTRTSVTVISDLSVYVLRFLAEKSVFLHNYDLKLNEIRMEERRVADYFVVAGLPKNPLPLGDFSCDGAPLKSTHNLPPITDITVINRSLGEVTPDGYFCIELTPSGLVANLNHGALRSPEMFLCYRRGRDKQPLVDIGVLYEGRERVMADSQIVEFTHGGRNANINPSGQTTYMTYRRASDTAACNELVVSDICVIMTNRGDQAPHSYCTIDRNLNKGTVVGSDIYVCYKKSMNRSNYIAYRAGIMDSFPFHHHPDFPIPTDLALFCLPMGATLESWPARASLPQPVFSTFVLTVTAGEGNTEAVEKVYGAAISFYEKYSHDRLTQEQRESLKLDEHFGWHNIVHTNKCICILSRWPFFDTFEKFLRYLHHMAIGGSYSVPIERYIYHFVESVPFPSARRPRILIQLDATERISLAQPEDSPISLSGAKFRQLVMTLRPEGCLLVLLFALTEQKILLHSLRPDVLTAVAEAITMIIFPFHWQCPYVPLCPLGLSDFLNAPIPFLLGLDSRFFDLYDPPTDVICIDLDTGAMSVPEDKRHLVTKILPRRATRTLRATLENLCEKIHKFEKSLQQHLKSQKNEPDSSIDSDFKMKRKEQQLDVEIQEAFLRFTATILKGYSNYLLPIVSAKAGAACDTSSLFDLDAFVKSRDRAYHKFYQLLVNTQLFSKFIEERSFVSDKDASLAFFDDCAEKVTEDDTTLRLLEVEATQSEHTMFLPPPEPIYLPEGVLYSYKDFPKLNPELFPTEEPKPALPAQVKQPQATPASPLARRTKHEVKSAQKLASRHAQTPILWAKCLLSSCYSLWFTQLPAFASTQHHKARFLQLAFRILTNMQKLNLSQADEVSYRVMMQLCGQYSQPILAVKVLCEMRQHGITPNAITYGYYNRAVMENKWTHSNLFWKKLRNVVIGVSAFKQSGLERAQRRKSSLSLDEVDKCLTDADSASRVSLESGASIDSHPPAPHAKTDTLSSDPGYCSVSETSESVSSPGAPPTAVPVTKDITTPGGSSVTVSSFSFPPPSCKDTSVPTHSAVSNSISPLSALPATTVPSGSSLTLMLKSNSNHGLDTHPSVSIPSTSTTPTNTRSPLGLASTIVSSRSDTPLAPSSCASLASPSSSSVVSSSLTMTSTTCTNSTSHVPSTTALMCSSMTPSIISLSSSSSSSSLTAVAASLSSLISSDISAFPLLSVSDTSCIIPSSSSLKMLKTSSSVSAAAFPFSTSASVVASSCCTIVPSYTSSITTTTAPSSSSFSTSYATSRALDFSESDALRARLGSIVRSSAASLAGGADLLMIEYNVAFSSSAGLLMSSALNNTVFDAASRNRQRPSDLADALSPTLDQYDKMSEATAVRTSPEVQTPIAQEKVVPEYLRSDSYGNDAKIITNLLRLTKVEIEPLAQVYQIRTSSSPVSAEDIQSSLEDQKAALADLKNADLLSRSNDSLSDISEEETPSRAGVVRGFFSRNAPERLSNLFKRSVDSADEKLRGFWKRSGSVSRSSSKDSVNLEQGVSDYLEGGRESSAEKSSGDRSSTERSSVEKDGDTDLICMKKTPEPPVALDKAEQKPETPTSMKPQSLLFPPRSPNINIDRTHNYSPIPSSPIRTPVTENDPLGAFSPQSTEEADPKAGLSSYSSMTASVVSESTSSTRESPSRHSSASDDSELVAHLSGHRGHRRSNRQVARSATFTGRTSQDPVRRFQRSSNSLWALSSSPSPTHSSSPQPSRTLPSDHTQSDDSNSALMSATPTWPSLKLPFSYSNSSSRLGMASNMASVGLRQATKQIEQLRAQYIDPAMADLGQYSPGNFNYRKNELISGGLSSMKSAVTSLSKKYNEIRDAITATNVPTRSGLPSSRMGEGEGDEDSLDGFWSRRESADVPGLAPLDDPGGIPIGASGGLNESDAISTQQDLFPPLGWDPQGPFCLGIWLTSCTRCHNCAALLYDEEIMAGWRPDDSNLNTKCTFCERMTVPLLTIIIYDLRHEPRPAKQAEDLSSESGKSTPAPPGANSDATDKGAPTEDTSKEEPRPESLLKDGVGILLQKKGVRCEPITIPYLSPLVLRKELETVLSHEGDVCLNNTDFTDHHPILYWNLLWYFCRLRVPSHLPGLCLTAASVTRDRTPHPSWEGADWQNVYIKCLWDNTKYHEELGQPMYIQWQQDKQPSQLVSALVRERTKVPRDVMQSVITAIHMDDLSTAMKLMLQELRKRPSNLRRNHFPIYRDLLFLAFSCIPPAQLNLTSFDREYRRAYERNEQANSKLLSRSDAPPPIAAVFCRRYFSQLSL